MSQMDRETECNAQRIGKISASHKHELMAQGKGGSPSVTRDKYMIRLIKERLTGVIEENFQSKAMTWGIETEDEARNAYFGETLNLVQAVLFVDWHGQDMEVWRWSYSMAHFMFESSIELANQIGTVSPRTATRERWVTSCSLKARPAASLSLLTSK